MKPADIMRALRDAGLPWGGHGINEEAREVTIYVRSSDFDVARAAVEPHLPTGWKLEVWLAGRTMPVTDQLTAEVSR